MNALRVAFAVVALVANGAAVADPRADRLDDYDRFCAFVGGHYAYFDGTRPDWDAACRAGRGAAADAPDRAAFVAVVERTLDALHDPHAHLGTSGPTSHRLVPTDADVHATWQDGRATIVDVREPSAAADAGVRPGMEVVAIDGLPVVEAVARWLSPALRSDDPAARDWALDIALAGLQDDRPVRVAVALDGVRSEHAYVPVHRAAEAVAARCFGDVAHLRFGNSIGDVATVAAFDAALDSLPCRRAIVLDLRDTPSGGNSTVARGILGRFVDRESAYQRHERIDELRETGIRHVWLETVEPRGRHVVAPLVVLVGHWTGSMGEGIAIGADAVRGAPVVGRPMAGLLGALDEERLPHAGFVVRVPAERLTHVDGTPREAFLPRPLPPGRDPLCAAVEVARGLSR